MPRKTRNEISYYPEIKQFLQEQMGSNFIALKKPLSVYVKTGELKKGLDEIIRDNHITTPAILKLADSTPPLSLDIFALITDGDKYELVIIEVKLKTSVGLTELSQLIGYCIVSNAQYGILVNVDGGESNRLKNLIVNEPDLTHIVRTLVHKKGTVEHNLGVMEWDSDTHNLTYSGYGSIRTISELCKKLADQFI